MKRAQKRGFVLGVVLVASSIAACGIDDSGTGAFGNDGGGDATADGAMQPSELDATVADVHAPDAPDATMIDAASTADASDASAFDASTGDATDDGAAAADDGSADDASTDDASDDASPDDAGDDAGDDASTDDAGDDASDSAPPPTTYTIHVGPGGGHTFSPSTQTIAVGDTVHWVWDSSFHNVVSGAPGVSDGKFCSPNNTACATAPLSNVGHTYDVTFTSKGSFPYYCAAHFTMGMTGTITVQ